MFYNIIRATNPLRCLQNTIKAAGCSTRITTRKIGSDSAAYDGDGKTTVRVLNQEETHLNLIATYSARGFRLSNNVFVNGSLLLFPTQVFSWNVRRGIDVNMESLLLFDLLVPKIKILIIGYGQLGEPYDPTIVAKMRKKGISCELLPTQHAVTTYNFLVHDSVHVAGAFVPMREDVKMTDRDFNELNEYDRANLERSYGPDPDYKRETQQYRIERAQEFRNRDKGKTSFEDER